MKKYLFFAAALLTLAACNNDDNLTVDDPNAPVEIRLSSGIQVQTRATQEDVIANGETVYVWADERTPEDVTGIYFNAWELTSDGNNGFTEDADKKYFPDSGNPVDLYALHGNFTPVITKDGTPFPAEGITHIVETDQRTTGNYEKSDLLYASLQSVERKKDKIELEFYHMLSKVEIAIRPGEGLELDDIKDATVSVLNTNTSVTFTPKKLPAEEMGNETNRIGMVETVESSVNEITLPTAAVEDTSEKFESAESYGEAIIAPQTLEEGKQFIKVKLPGEKGGELFYTIPDGGKTFDSGKKYIYRITVNLTELQVETSITPWISGDESTGEAEM